MPISVAAKLNTEIAQTIIAPNDLEDRVRKKAEEMGYLTSLTQEDCAKVYNAVISEIINQIEDFINERKKIDNSREINMIQANSFRTDIQNLVHEAIKSRYQVDVIPSFTELSSSEPGYCTIL